MILLANIIDSHLANIINHDLDNNSFSESAKIGTARPIYKRNDRDKIENYRFVSILNCFSKLYGDFFRSNLSHLWKLFSQALLQLLGKGTVVIMS